MGIRKQEPGRQGVRDVQLSFETGEQGATRVYFPYQVRIVKLRSSVLKALAVTDSGTITGANLTGASTGGVLTHLASAAIGNEATPVTPSTNNVVSAGSYYQLTTAKTTVGGKVTVSVEYVTD